MTVLNAKAKPSKIELSAEPFGIDVKRLYLPMVIEVVCPTCGKTVRRDFSEHHIGYPTFNATRSVRLWCFDRESGVECSEIEVLVRIGLTVTAAT